MNVKSTLFLYRTSRSTPIGQLRVNKVKPSALHGLSVFASGCPTDVTPKSAVIIWSASFQFPTGNPAKPRVAAFEAFSGSDSVYNNTLLNVSFEIQ